MTGYKRAASEFLLFFMLTFVLNFHALLNLESIQFSDSFHLGINVLPAAVRIQRSGKWDLHLHGTRIPITLQLHTSYAYTLTHSSRVRMYYYTNIVWEREGQAHRRTDNICMNVHSKCSGAHVHARWTCVRKFMKLLKCSLFLNCLGAVVVVFYWLIVN